MIDSYLTQTTLMGSLLLEWFIMTMITLRAPTPTYVPRR